MVGDPSVAGSPSPLRHRRASRLGRRGLLLGAGATLAVGALAAALARSDHPPEGRALPNRLVIAQGADPSGLHPLLGPGLVEASAYGNVYDPLVALDADGRRVPALAESWEPRDEHAWTFNLRPGVSFHNGEPFDSASVRFTIEQLLDRPTPRPSAPSSMRSSASRRRTTRPPSW